MELLEQFKQLLLKLHQTGNKEQKTQLESAFTKQFFVKKSVSDLKTFEQCCEYEGTNPIDILPYKNPQNKIEISINAYAKLIVVYRVKNEGWVPDYTDGNQYKYYPWFVYKSGLGFWGSNCDNTRTSTVVGSRLCTYSRDLAIQIGNDFQSIYNEYL